MYLSFFCFVVTVNGTTLIRNPQSQSGSRIHVLQVSTAYYYIQLPELLLLVFFFLSYGVYRLAVIQIAITERVFHSCLGEE